MSNPEWYIDLSNSLKKHFEEESDLKSVSGEQFLRNYFIEHPLESFSEEDDDQLVEEHLDSIQKYLITLDWLRVDEESYRWIKGSVVQVIKNQKSQGEKERLCNITRLNELYKKTTHFDIDEIEWIKQELLIENCIFDNLEGLTYKLASQINHHTNFTFEDKYNAWFNAAACSSTDNKYVECLEFASDCKASQFKFDDAASCLEDVIYKLEPILKIQKNNSWFGQKIENVKRRINLTFEGKSNENHERILRIIRKCRVYYEQAGNRAKSSHLFVIETDIIKRSKNRISRVVLFLYWLFSKYGESPVRVLISSLFIIFTWAFFYTCMKITYNLNTGDADLDAFMTNVYFSIVTFTTLGYGDFSPPQDGRLLASIQAMLGLFMTSLFLVTFVRRYSR